MTDIIVVLILFAVLCSAGFYVYRAKKNGQKCVGCPYSKECGKGCACNTKE